MLTNARIFIQYWATKNRVVATSLATILLDHMEAVRAFNLQFGGKLRPIPKYALEAAFEEYINGEPERQRALIAKAIQCAQENLEPLKAWVKAVTGGVNQDDVYIMAHWLWLVKRNAYNMPVVHHIMPIITSPKQGGGKSTAVKKLLEPLEASSLELQVPQVVDERSFTLFTNYLVGFFDEMAGADKVEISTFKRNVTSSSLTYRPMRTNAQMKIKNLCSFIGASNNQIYEIVKDTTGLRRFFPIKALNLLDHKAINAIDYTELWQGIDEFKERGYFELVKDTVAQKQDEMSMKDEVALFLEDHDIVPTSTTTQSVSGKQLYNEYIIYTKNAGIRFPVSAQTFYKKLRDSGIEAAKRPDSNKVLTWFFAINPNAAINTNKVALNVV